MLVVLCFFQNVCTSSNEQYIKQFSGDWFEMVTTLNEFSASPEFQQ